MDYEKVGKLAISKACSWMWIARGWKKQWHLSVQFRGDLVFGARAVKILPIPTHCVLLWKCLVCIWSALVPGRLDQCWHKEGLGRHGRRSRVWALVHLGCCGTASSGGCNGAEHMRIELGQMKFHASAESMWRLKKQGRKHCRIY